MDNKELKNKFLLCPIDTDLIQGRWQEEKNGSLCGGDDTLKSIKIVAEKVNELVDFLNQAIINERL